MSTTPKDKNRSKVFCIAPWMTMHVLPTSETLPCCVTRMGEGIGDVRKNTMEEIKKYSDRKIILHDRTSKISLLDLLHKAWAFVSDHSSAGFMAMQSGVPAYFTNSTLKNIGSVENIERHEINYSVFNNLAYEQWKIDEIKSGECWQYLSK